MGPTASRRVAHRRLVAAANVAIAGAGLALAAGRADLQHTPPPNPIPVRPNIVLLLADDLSLAAMDLAANATLEDGSLFMPNFRRFIQDRAVEFRQTLSPNPVCCPARATLLTGQYSHNTGVFSNAARNGAILAMQDGSDRDGDGSPDGDTLALALQRAGYRTAHVGKYLNGCGILPRSLPGDRKAAYDNLLSRYRPEQLRGIMAADPKTGRTYEPPGWTGWYGSLDTTTYCAYNTVFSVDGRPILFHSSGQALDPDRLPDPLPSAGSANLSDRRHPGAQPQVPRPSRRLIGPVVPVDQHARSAHRDVRLELRALAGRGTGHSGRPFPFLGNANPPEEGGQGYRAQFLETVRPAPRDLALLARFRGAAAAFLATYPSFDEADPSDKPSFLRSKGVPMEAPYLDGPAGSPDDRYPYSLDSAILTGEPPFFNRNISLTSPRDQAIDQLARMMASMGAVDRMIGAIAARLEAQGRLSNTVFVFTSDNGYSHGQHRLNSKLLAYEESIRVPLYISLPGLTTPLRSWGVALLTDIAPTLLDMASTPGAPARLLAAPDGTSLKLLLQYPAMPWRRQALIEHFTALWPGEPMSLNEHPSLFAVRTSHHNTETPNRLYAEYFSGMQYAAAPGPQGWAAGFYRSTCRPGADPDGPAAALHCTRIRPFIHAPGESPDRLPEPEYYNLDLDPYELTNGFGAGAPRRISDLAAQEVSSLRCRLNALTGCEGPGCRAAEWAASCP